MASYRHRIHKKGHNIHYAWERKRTLQRAEMVRRGKDTK